VLTIGTMNFGARTPAPEAARIIERALERGVTLFDTANIYTKGESEKIVGATLKGRGQIATKCGALGEGLKKERVLAACDESLKRLGRDFIDLYYLHTPDPKTPVSETLEAIAALLNAGKIKSWGVSNYASWQILELDLLSDKAGLPRPTTSQVVYNLLVRQLDLEYFAFARRFPIHTTIYNPLAGGLLAGGKRGENNAIYAKRYWTQPMLDLAAKYRALATEHGLELVTLAYAWVATRPGVDSIICGPGTLAHLDAAIDACARTLPDALRAQVDELHRAHLGTDAIYAR
jgi:aryl-alcohol dehydrogenase-like predicted oxidoreductase